MECWEDTYEMTLLAGGWQGIANLAVNKGGHPIDFATGSSRKDISSLWDIAGRIGSFSRLEDINAYWKSLRDLTWIKQGLETGTAKVDLEKTIEIMESRHSYFNDITKVIIN